MRCGILKEILLKRTTHVSMDPEQIFRAKDFSGRRLSYILRYSQETKMLPGLLEIIETLWCWASCLSPTCALFVIKCA
jgi:hypothetical protein